ncbi:dihydroxyacetone kinase [Urinicoccus massiliensis]|uniref:Dihydroxyacetone kinase n=1 Tax=Urinicoccus massiliensis TaxID=1723382 RepID=A0A8H2M4K3_9FIRM|nr:DAK2 domain-containing protein [Urinicoccus massiliensis]VFB16442.1 dihydroxyacetone kinase [Urinicoccus massiliensis]
MRIEKNKFIEVLQSSVNNLLNHKEEVNALNVFPVPDGDTGTNMSLTIKSALEEVKRSVENDLGKLAKDTARGSLMGARGNSGVILSQYFRGLAEGSADLKNFTPAEVAHVLTQASKTTYNAVMKPTEGTILTVGRETAEFANRFSKKESTDILLFLGEVLEAGKKSLANTPNLLPVLKEAKVVDAGGQGLIYILEGAYLALKGQGVQSLTGEEAKDLPSQKVSSREKISTDDIQFGYCTEFMIQTESNDVDGFRNKLKPLGDCLLVVGGEGIIKTHIHTNHPGKALEYAVELGQLKDIKIDNMRFQHEEVLLKDELEEMRSQQVESPQEDKDYGFVAVSMGEGLSEIFKEIQVDQVIFGGQTMNPSTQDFVKSIQAIPAKTIYLLPNNSNIIMAAEQAAEISEKDVHVIPSKTVPQGIAAMLAFNEESDPHEVEEAMTQAIQEIRSGSVTYAVRDTTIKNQEIKKGNFIGLYEKEITSFGDDLEETTIQLIRDMAFDDAYMVTIYYGEDVDIQDAEDLKAKLEEEFEDLDVDIIPGGQPLYYYLVSIE